MDRKELYQIIKDNNLSDEIKNYFGKNYTVVSSISLEEFISNFYSDCLDDTDEEEDTEDDDNTTASPYEAACIAFLGILKDCGVLNSMLAKL